MEFLFKIIGDKLIDGTTLSGKTENVNTYICRFEIEDSLGLLWLCVFRKDGAVYQSAIENGRCIIPHEVLMSCGKLEIGCYGISPGDEVKRVSTNWLSFTVEEGAYKEADAPKEPTPDVWESLVKNSLPYVGEDGNWYVYDKEKGEYVNSGKTAKGEKGDSPKRGIDYWTEEDKSEIKAYVEDAILGGAW